MIKLELDLQDVDFDALAQRFLPQVAEKLGQAGGALGVLGRNMPESMVLGIVKRMSPAAKERMAVELIQSQKGLIAERLAAAAQSQGIRLTITGIAARTEEKP